MGKLKLLVAAAAAFAMTPAVMGFGGEDIAQGNPWHHVDITMRALTGDEYYEPAVKFSGGADAIAWHADNIDSYLYNPAFWGQGVFQSSAVQRTKAALLGFENLAKLHFDDTFTTGGIKANWERYAMGTLIGLLWASEQGGADGIAAAHHILGVSVHAVQDFYSHSNWVTDTTRRCHTFFETPIDTRNGMVLFSGAYEKPLSGAPAHHGAYSFSCTALRGQSMDDAMDIACDSLSPLQNTSICETYRVCLGGQEIKTRLEDGITDGITTIYNIPPGIALDNTALSRINAQNRRLITPTKNPLKGRFMPLQDGMHFPRERCTDIINAKEGGPICKLPGPKEDEFIDADHVFAGTKDVAIRATMEWIEYLEDAMIAMGKGQFWNRVKSRNSGDSYRYDQFEDFSKLPYHFLAAGAYPVGNPARDASEPPSEAKGWFLRLRIKTARTAGAGTDANIYARVKTSSGVTPVLLDYLPTNDKEGRTTNRLLVYNDFEAGDDDTYTIGPFHDRPISVQLFNDGSDFSEVLSALATDFSHGVDETLTDARQFFIGFIGGNADFVGSNGTSYTAGQLRERLSSQREFRDKIHVDGGQEGVHDVEYRVINRRNRLTRKEREDGWMAVEVELRSLYTEKESENDRGTNSDEPFVIFHFAPLNGLREIAHTYLSPPFEDMDDNEREPFPGSRAKRRLMKIPPEGLIVLSAAIYESDSENQRDRETLKREFATGLDENTQRPASEFADTLGRAIAEAWDVGSIEVYAFHRSARSLAGPVLRPTVVGEIDGDEMSEEYDLDWSKLTDIGAALSRRNVPTILELKQPHADAKSLLHGKWYSDAYQCDGEIPYMEVDVKEGDDERLSVVAKKTERVEGDDCYNETPGEEGLTFRGTFEDGVLTGERHITPPPKDRRKEYDPDNPLDNRPNYYDTAIHPRMDLEGNWIINFGNSEEPETYATLYKGGSRQCYDYDDGCWYHWKRDPSAGWGISFWQNDNPGLAHSESVTFSGNAMQVDWNYFMHGHWGGESQLTAGQDTISGSWSYGEDETGSESWRRVVPKVTRVEHGPDDARRSEPVGEPLVIVTDYVRHAFFMRGNRSDIYLDLMGENLWGVQHVFIPGYTDLELYGVRYICQYDGANGYPTHPNWKVCLDQGGVRGIRVSMNVWPQAYSGEHILYVNDQEIPFELKVNNEPLRDPEWQDMKMEFSSCSVLQEVDRDYYDQPFRLIRQDFTKRP